jgi:capsule polysaccharide export protein KpsE/RkpR
MFSIGPSPMTIISEKRLVNRLNQTTLESFTDEQDLVLAPEVGQGDGSLGEPEPEALLTARLLWKQRVWLGKAILIGAVIAAIIAFLIPSSYDATVQLMPPDNASLSGGGSSVAMLGLLMGSGMGSGSSSSATGSLAGTVGELLGAQRPGALLMGILASRTLRDRIIDRFDLRKVYWRKTYAATREKLADHIVAIEDRKSGLVRITLNDHDRARCVAMTVAYVEELNHLLAQVNTSSAGREREFLEGRLTAIHKELQESAKQLSEFSSRNTTLDPQDQGKATLDAAAVLQGQVIAAQSELSGLEQIYTGDNVRVRSLRARVAALQQQLDSLGGKNYTGSKVLDSNSLYPSLRQLPILDVQYADLYRRVKIDETVFALLTEAYELAKVQEAKETPSVKVLDAPRWPEKKSGPFRTGITILGGFLGLTLGCAWILGTEYWGKIDPKEPYKVFLCQEMLPVLRRKTARVSNVLQRFAPPIHPESTDDGRGI